MAKTKKSFDYKDPFPCRFRNLIEEKGATLDALAAEFNTTRQTVSNWQNGVTVPDAVSICDIARYFGVTTDYLLGLTDVKTIETDVRAVAEYTGLSEDAIKALSNPYNPHLQCKINDIGGTFSAPLSAKDIVSDFIKSKEFSTVSFEMTKFFSQYLRFAETYREKREWIRFAPRDEEFYKKFLEMWDSGLEDLGVSDFFSGYFSSKLADKDKKDIEKEIDVLCSDKKDFQGNVLWDRMAWDAARSEAKEETNGSDLSRFRIQQAIQSYLDDVESSIMNRVLEDESDGENH